MPEGHTLHRLAAAHQRQFAARPVAVSSPQGRFADGAARVHGRVLTSAWAQGKHLFHEYDDLVVHIHLGLYGAFTETPRDEAPAVPAGQVRMRMVGEDVVVDLRGPTACEVLTPREVDTILDRLGPDPLDPAADPDVAWRRIAASSRSIAALLMDQRVVAGVGNVYRAEVLFRQRLNPLRRGRDLSRAEFDAVWQDLVTLMPIGVARGRIHVIRPEDDLGAPSYAKDRPRTYVYRRSGDPCRLCSTPILSRQVDARTLFWCPTCQA